jgi:hypothetical protein
MNSPRFAGFVARLLSRAAPAPVTPSEADRARAIVLIEHALAQKARRRLRSRWLAGSAAALAVAAGILLLLRTPKHPPPVNPVVVIGRPMGSGARLMTSSGSEPLRSGSPLPPGGRLIADANGGAALRLSTGTEIAIEHDASLAFNDAGPTEHFVLSQGSIRAHVAKLTAGERFIVSTPDADVEVHGTVFGVAVVQPEGSCGAGTRTRVTVDEGVVEVRSGGRSSFVHPGEIWPANCGPTVASGVQLGEQRRSGHAPSSTAGRLASSVPDRPGSPSVAEPTLTASRLAEQNDLFSRGVAARREGDNARALAAFNALLDRYPGSALAESATAERMRVLAKTDRSAARRAAKEYLARYAQGFARPDAEAILAQ